MASWPASSTCSPAAPRRHLPGRHLRYRRVTRIASGTLFGDRITALEITPTTHTEQVAGSPARVLRVLQADLRAGRCDLRCTHARTGCGPQPGLPLLRHAEQHRPRQRVGGTRPPTRPGHRPHLQPLTALAVAALSLVSCRALWCGGLSAARSGFSAALTVVTFSYPGQRG